MNTFIKVNCINLGSLRTYEALLPVKDITVILPATDLHPDAKYFATIYIGTGNDCYYTAETLDKVHALIRAEQH